MTTKVCTACKQEKPVSGFHHYGKNLASIGKWCEPCYQSIKTKRGKRLTPNAPRAKS